MSRSVLFLSGLAALQLALAAVTWWPSSGPDQQTRDLVDLPDAIDFISIQGRLQPGESESSGSVDLRRDGDHWVLPGLYDFPVEQAKIDELLEKLENVEVRVPVAHQATSHSSLNVADDDNARRITLASGETKRSLVMGSASGQAVHVRRADEARVYDLRGWNAWSIGETDNRYWESRLVTVPVDAFDSLTVNHDGAGFTLEKTAESWTAAGQELTLDDNAIDALLQRLSNLRLSKVVGTERSPDLDSGTQLVWTAQVGDQTVRGALSIGDSNGADTTVQVDGSPWVVQVPASSVKRWTELTLQDLVFEDDLEGMDE